MNILNISQVAHPWNLKCHMLTMAVLLQNQLAIQSVAASTVFAYIACCNCCAFCHICIYKLLQLIVLFALQRIADSALRCTNTLKQ